MTEADAMAAIGGDMPFPFGKWRGVPFNKVPDEISIGSSSKIGPTRGRSS